MVAAFAYEVAASGDAALFGRKVQSHRRNHRDPTGPLPRFGRPDQGGDILSVQHHFPGRQFDMQFGQGGGHRRFVFLIEAAKRNASATARYIAPVSRNWKPSRSARRRAAVLLPLPAGPSMVTIMKESYGISSATAKRLDD